MARPGVFNVRARYSRVHCEEPGYEDLWAEIRTNLRHDERAEFIESLHELNGVMSERVQIVFDAVTAAERRVAEAENDTDEFRAARLDLIKARGQVDDLIAANDPDMAAVMAKRQALVAPYIRAWNVVDDEYNDVPAPADGGDDSWGYLDFVSTAWLLGLIQNGFRGGKGVRTLSLGSANTPVPMSGPQIVTAPAAA